MVRKNGGTFAITRRTPVVTKGPVADFRPFSLAVAADGDGFWLVDWGYNGWLDARAQSGRLYRLRYNGPDAVRPAPRPSGRDRTSRLAALDHPALSVRRESQRMLAGLGPAAVPDLVARLRSGGPEAGRIHAIWALDAIGGPEASRAIVASLADPSARVRLQAARSAGIRRDRDAPASLAARLKDRDAAVRREAAIAIGKIGDPSVAAALYAALDDSDRFAAWSVQAAIRRLQAWDKDALVAALLDGRRTESTLELTDEAWAVPVVEALGEALRRSEITARPDPDRRQPGGALSPVPGMDGRAGSAPTRWPANSRRRPGTGRPRGWRRCSAAWRRAWPTGMARSAPGRSTAWPRRDRPPPRCFAPPWCTSPTRATRRRWPRRWASSRDVASMPVLAAWLADAARPLAVRTAALRGLSTTRAPQSLRARLALIYDPDAPPALVAAALPGLAGAGLLPANELSTFLENRAAPIRAAALMSLNVNQPLPAEIKRTVLDRLDDPAREVREAATLAVVAFRMSEAVPRLLALAGRPESADRSRSIAALCRLPDPRAVSIYLAAIRDGSPGLRQAGESALLAIRDRVPAQIAAAARLGGVLRPGGSLARAGPGPVRADPRVAGDRAVPQGHAPDLPRRALDRLRPHPRRRRRPADLMDDAPRRSPDRTGQPREPETQGR